MLTFNNWLRRLVESEYATHGTDTNNQEYLQRVFAYIDRSSLGVSRKSLPQISEVDLVQFMDCMTKSGIKISFEKIPVGKIRSAQKSGDLRPDKIIRFSEEDNTKPALACIEGDTYCLIDGNNKWAGLLLRVLKTGDKNLTLNTVVIHSDLRTLLNHLCVGKFAWN